MGLFDFLRGKKVGASAGSEASRPIAAAVTRHCFVLCRSASAGDLSQASTVVAQTLGLDYAAEVADGGIVTILRGGNTVGFLAYIPAPIPTGEAEECADGNLLWPDGGDQAAQHRSHIVVTAASDGSGGPVESALAVTRLALVALRLFDGFAVYWGNASVTNSRAVFEAFANADGGNLPIPVWLRFQIVRPSEGETAIYTLGMDQFGLMDIETAASRTEPAALFELVAGIAQHLVTNRPVIADGDTVGWNAEQRLRVRHRPSMVDPTRRVYTVFLTE